MRLCYGTQLQTQADKIAMFPSNKLTTLRFAEYQAAAEPEKMFRKTLSAIGESYANLLFPSAITRCSSPPLSLINNAVFFVEERVSFYLKW